MRANATTVGETDTTASTDSENNLFGINISTTGEDGGLTSALQIVIVLTILALCPSILIMLTSFTRILIVLHFTRSALNTQTAPPNQILIGLSLFLTFSNIYFITLRISEHGFSDRFFPSSCVSNFEKF